MTIMNLECEKCGWRPATEDSKVSIGETQEDNRLRCPQCKGILRDRYIREKDFRISDSLTLQEMERRGKVLWRVGDQNLTIEYYLDRGRIFIKTLITPATREREEGNESA